MMGNSSKLSADNEDDDGGNEDRDTFAKREEKIRNVQIRQINRENEIDELSQDRLSAAAAFTMYSLRSSIFKHLEVEPRVRLLSLC
jgi:hypothetical protein